MLLKVFLVEDETVIREGLRDRIPWDQFGYRFVGEAADGEMALPLIRKTRPDVLITDIKMPFMDGLSLSKIVSKEFPRMKIIIVSGYDDFEYARQAIEVGVDQYLLKPVTRMKLKTRNRRITAPSFRMRSRSTSSFPDAVLWRKFWKGNFPLRRFTTRQTASPLRLPQPGTIFYSYIFRRKIRTRWKAS